VTAALEGGEWSAARPGRNLTQGKTWYPFYRSLGGPQGRSGRAENFVPTGIRSRTVQPKQIDLYEPYVPYKQVGRQSSLASNQYDKVLYKIGT